MRRFCYRLPRRFACARTRAHTRAVHQRAEFNLATYLRTSLRTRTKLGASISSEAVVLDMNFMRKVRKELNMGFAISALAGTSSIGTELQGATCAGRAALSASFTVFTAQPPTSPTVAASSLRTTRLGRIRSMRWASGRSPTVGSAKAHLFARR